MPLLVCGKVTLQARLAQWFKDCSWFQQCFSLKVSTSGQIIDLPSWAVLREREQYKWKASQTLESSLCVPVCRVTNRPLGLRLALITPHRHRTILFVSFPWLSAHTTSVWRLYFTASLLAATCCLCPSVLLCRIQHGAAQSSLFSHCQPLINILKWWSIFENQLGMTFSLWIKASSSLTLKFNVKTFLYRPLIVDSTHSENQKLKSA